MRTFAPRTVKDEIEEALFTRRRDLFTDLSVLFMDATSLSFHGEGGETLGARGFSKDDRPDFNQMIVGVLVDGEPAGVLGDVARQHRRRRGARPRHRSPAAPLRQHLGCVVADRGMISAETIAALEERGLEYVPGVRERTDKLVREKVLTDNALFTPLLVERAKGETQLFVKKVPVDGRRCIV